MALIIGSRLGHYNVTSLLGEGGTKVLVAVGRYPEQPMGLAPGTSIGHYDVTSLLGEGGMEQPVR